MKAGTLIKLYIRRLPLIPSSSVRPLFLLTSCPTDLLLVHHSNVDRLSEYKVSLCVKA